MYPDPGGSQQALGIDTSYRVVSAVSMRRPSRIVDVVAQAVVTPAGAGRSEE